MTNVNTYSKQLINKITSKAKEYLPEIMIISVIMTFYIINSCIIWSYSANAPTNHLTTLHCLDISPVLDKLNYSSSELSIISLFKGRLYAPLQTLTAVIIIKLFGADYILLPLIINSVCLLLLLIFIYFLGREIADRKTGILALIILSLIPNTYIYFNDYFMDYTLMGLTCITVYALIRSGLFKKRLWTVVLALSFGMGMMTKYPYIAYVSGPVFIGLLNVFRSVKKKIYTELINLLIFSLIVLIIIFPRYLDSSILSFVISNPGKEPSGFAWYDMENLRLFTIGLLDNQLSLPIFVLFVVSLRVFIKKIKTEYKFIIFLWILITYMAVIFMPHGKSIRFLLPIMPAFAIISAVGSRELIKKRSGSVFTGVILVTAFLQYFTINHNMDLGVFNWKLKLTDKIYLSNFQKEYNNLWLEKSPSNRQYNKVIYSNIKRELMKYYPYPEYTPRITILPVRLINEASSSVAWVRDLDSYWLDGTHPHIIPLYKIVRSPELFRDPVDFIVYVNPELAAHEITDKVKHYTKPFIANEKNRIPIYNEEGFCSVYIYVNPDSKFRH